MRSPASARRRRCRCSGQEARARRTPTPSSFAPRARDHDSIEFVVDVRDEEELELALELLDPEIFLLGGEGSDEHDDPLDAVLELLPDVPAGKLAIADVAVVSRHEVLALERAGMDAVLVPAGSVAGLSATRRSTSSRRTPARRRTSRRARA